MPVEKKAQTEKPPEKPVVLPDTYVAMPDTYIAAADRAEIPAWILHYAPFVVNGKPADEATGDQHEA